MSATEETKVGQAGVSNAAMDARISQIVQRETGQETTPVTVRCALCPDWTFTGHPDAALVEQHAHATLHPRAKRKGQKGTDRPAAEREAAERRRMHEAAAQRHEPGPLSEGGTGPAADEPHLPATGQPRNSSGPGSPEPPPSLSSPCDQIISDIQRWAAEHDGVPPKSSEWLVKKAGYPTYHAVRKEFLSWGDALQAAGFAPHEHRGFTSETAGAARQAATKTDQHLVPGAASPASVEPFAADPEPDAGGAAEGPEDETTLPPGGASSLPREAALQVLDGLQRLVDHYWPSAPESTEP